MSQIIQSLLSCNVVLRTLNKTLVKTKLDRKISGISELAASCKSDSMNILISGIVPRRDKLNKKAPDVDKKWM